jgi:hypothetical protein
MITIRYAALPEGFHAQAEAHGRRTVIYLRPGLTAEQRRLSLRRARQSARMGYGPRLPGPGVALAVARHVAGGTLRNLAAAVRGHPIGFLLLSASLAALATCYAYFVTVSVRLVLDPPQAPPGRYLPARLPPAAVAPRRGPVTRPGPAAPAPGHAGRARPGTPRDSPAGHRLTPGPGPAARPSPSAVPAATPAPPASPSPGTCVTVGPVRVCV